MANIDVYLAQILAATYGEEVRGSIHDAIFEINNESVAAKEYAEGQKNSAKYYAELAASWSEHPPYIGPNGNWFIYDTSTKSFKDSGIDADRTLTIEDITMLGENETPVVTNTGTASDPIYHLFIPRGRTGNGIVKIEKTSTNVLADTYTITYSNGTSKTFIVNNGKGISSFRKTDTQSLTDIYTIAYNDGTSDTFQVDNGKGIKKIEKTDTDVLNDTYTITYNDNTTSTFIISNGKGISSFVQQSKIGLVTTYRITYNDGEYDEFSVTDGNGIERISKTSIEGLKDIYTIKYDNGSTDEFYVNNGKGIVSIAKTDTVGIVDIYTITFNDGSTYDFQITNGRDGDGSVSSVNGIWPTGGDVRLRPQDVHAVPEQAGERGQVLGFTSTDTVGPLMVLDSIEDFALNRDDTALVNAITIAELLDEEIVSATLLASNWVDNIYTLETVYPSTQYKLQIYLDTDNCSEEQEKAFNKAKFRPFSVQNNLKCYKEVPKVDIPIIIKIRRIG